MVVASQDVHGSVAFGTYISDKTGADPNTLGFGWDFGSWLMGAVGSSALPKLHCGCVCAPLDLVLNVKSKEIHVPRCVMSA